MVPHSGIALLKIDQIDLRRAEGGPFGFPRGLSYVGSDVSPVHSESTGTQNDPKASFLTVSEKFFGHIRAVVAVDPKPSISYVDRVFEAVIERCVRWTRKYGLQKAHDRIRRSIVTLSHAYGYSGSGFCGRQMRAALEQNEESTHHPKVELKKVTAAKLHN